MTRAVIPPKFRAPASVRNAIPPGGMHELLNVVKLINARTLVTWGGYPGLALIIFAETGLLIGFFLPGDSLLVTAALLAATSGLFNIYMLGLLLTLASILGNTAAYAFGRATGPRLFAREESLLFKRRHLVRAHDFYERHGGATVILARFMPIVRTFVPIVAGMAQMGYRRYTLYNVVGGTLWIWSMLFVGYVLGRYIPGVDSHIEGVILLVILLSLSPGIVGWLRTRSRAPEPNAVSDG
ncbi:MAG TPA: VTT domain-containing protein [Gemmatimonadaceae bacterium]|nr:VTT domain-containing protein [Gemmatimonadaceae bacterium]